MKYTATVHPKGLNPFQSAKAWMLRKKLKQPWAKIRTQLRTMSGDRPNKHAMRNAVARVQASSTKDGFSPKLNYGNCGKKPRLTDAQQNAIVEFVRKWRAKRFCTARYIIRELKLPCGKRTVHRVLNKAGFHWHRVSNKIKLTPEQLKKREAFVKLYIGKSQEWWVNNVGLVLDGVTLSTAPKALSAKEKHAAQSITHMWVLKGEALDNDLHTHNRYGVQLGIKVPLWGGFTGRGDFTLKLWTERPKLDKESWATYIGTAVEPAAASPNIWHDNEKFLKQPEVYAAHGLVMKNFPPNSGDLNPIETVWADLRLELARREMEDIDAGRHLTVAQFRQRASQILHSYAVPRPGQTKSRLQKYIAGMPKRLADCKANNYGKCGK